MMNLFESFDPMTNQFLSLNWMIMYMYLIIYIYSYWMVPNRINYLWNSLFKNLYKEFKTITKNIYQPNIIIFLTLMSYLMILNLLSLMPFTFTQTSQMSFNLSFSFSMWVSFMLYSLINTFNKFLIHLTPLNTPTVLMNFMVLIELVSNLIRPWTLAIRLTANLIAGHLLLILIGNFMNNFLLTISFSIILQNLLLILELAMSFIQAYVFSTLTLLYFKESKK